MTEHDKIDKNDENGEKGGRIPTIRQNILL